MEQLALIMAAGEGARMLSDLPKPLHSICGMPMVEHVLRALDTVAQEKALVVGRAGEQIRRALTGQARFITQQREQGWGTGHALISAAAFLEGREGQVIVTACDKPLVLPETYARMVEVVKRGASCALLTATVENPLGYSRILRQGGRVVCSARQEALSGEQFMIQEVDASVYCFDIQALLEVLPLLQEDRQGEKHLCDAVGLLSGQGGLICAVPALEKCEALGVNDRFQLSRAEAAMRRRINARHMRAGVTLVDPEHTYIQPEVSIAADVVLGPGCVLEKGTTIDRGCYVAFSRLSGAHVGAGARVEYAVVEDVTVAPGQRVGPYQGLSRRSGQN